MDNSEECFPIHDNDWGYDNSEEYLYNLLKETLNLKERDDYVSKNEDRL